MKQLIVSILSSILIVQPSKGLVGSSSQNYSPVVLASRQMDMSYRYHTPSVSDVFRDNILLNIAYLDGRVDSKEDVNWDEINKPFYSEFTLQPNQSFAFHDAVLPEYKDKVVVTTNAHFNQQDGFKTDGYLYGDGVCQLASLINWAAREAKLDVVQFTNHDFATIPEVPKIYGVAIYYDPNSQATSAKKNLYITNNQDKPVTFHFDYRSGVLKVTVSKVS